MCIRDRLETPVGFRTEKLLAPVSERLIDAGFDTEEYYCPMFPDEKLEHIVCADAGIAVISVNRYHDIDLGSINGKVISCLLYTSRMRTDRLHGTDRIRVYRN